MPGALVELQGLSKEFRLGVRRRRLLALDELDLEVRGGETLGLLGPNGAGKTTTIKLMLGLIFPTAGSVRLFGRTPQDPEARRRIGFLPENPYFYDYLTAQEYLRHAGELCGLPSAQTRARAATLLARVGLPEVGDRALRKFSKGMVQRLGLAQALINEPELIILDEPMSGLDPLGRRQVRELIMELRNAGRAVLFSSHVLSDVEAICDRVAILDRGRLVGTGLLSELLADESSGVELTVQGADAALGERLTALGCDLHEAGTVLSVRLADPQRQAEVLAAIAASGARLLTMNPIRRSLEEIFLRRVGDAKG